MPAITAVFQQFPAGQALREHFSVLVKVLLISDEFAMIILLLQQRRRRLGGNVLCVQPRRQAFSKFAELFARRAFIMTRLTEFSNDRHAAGHSTGR